MATNYHPSVIAYGPHPDVVDTDATAANIIRQYLRKGSMPWKSAKARLVARKNERIKAYDDMPFKDREDAVRPSARVRDREVVNFLVTHVIDQTLGGKQHTALIMDKPWKGGRRGDTVREFISYADQGMSVPMVEAERQGGRNALSGAKDAIESALTILPGDMEGPVIAAMNDVPAETMDRLSEGYETVGEVAGEAKSFLRTQAQAAHEATPGLIGGLALNAGDMAMESGFTSMFGPAEGVIKQAYSIARGQADNPMAPIFAEQTVGGRVGELYTALESFGFDPDLGENQAMMDAGLRLLSHDSTTLQDVKDIHAILMRIQTEMGPGIVTAIKAGAAIPFVGDAIKPVSRLISSHPAKLETLIKRHENGKDQTKYFNRELAKIVADIEGLQKNGRLIASAVEQMGLDPAMSETLSLIHSPQAIGAFQIVKGAILNDESMIEQGVTQATSNLDDRITAMAMPMPENATEFQAEQIGKNRQAMEKAVTAIGAVLTADTPDQVAPAMTAAVDAGTTAFAPMLNDETANLSAIATQMATGGDMGEVQGNLGSVVGGEFQDFVSSNPLMLLALMAGVGGISSGIGGLLGGMTGLPMGGALGAIGGGMLSPLILSILLGDENAEGGFEMLDNVASLITDPVMGAIPDSVMSTPFIGDALGGMADSPLRTLATAGGMVLGPLGLPGGDYLGDASSSTYGVDATKILTDSQSHAVAQTYEPAYGPHMPGGVPVNQMGSTSAGIAPQSAKVTEATNEVGAVTRSNDTAAALATGLHLTDPRDLRLIQ